MAYVPQLNIILNYLLGLFEAMTPAVYGQIKFTRYSGPVKFEDLDITLTDRAIRIYWEDSGKKIRAMHGSGYIRLRGNLVISLYYGSEVTELATVDKQGIESLIIADQPQCMALMASPALFASLNDQDYDRPIFNNARRKTSKVGDHINELLYDFEYKQPLT